MFFTHLKIIYYEIKSRLILEKVKYKVTGQCKQCGSCCKKIYSIDTYNEDEFKIMTKIFPQYKRFEIVDKDEYGLIFGCKLLGEDGKCTVYKKRLRMCKTYPFNKVRAAGRLPENCGFKILPVKSFKSYLD